MSEQEQTLLSLLEAPEKKAPAAKKKAQPQSQESPALPKDEKTPPQTEEKTAKTEEISIPTSVSLPQVWPYRLLGNAAILGIIFFLASLTITFKNDLINKRLVDLQNAFYDLTTNMGFTIEDIIIRGHNHTTKQEIADTLQLTRRDNILRQDLEEIRYKISQLPWVKDVAVRRTYFPNTIQINIEEHRVKCLWQFNEKFHPIDENGEVIEAAYTPNKPLLLIVGAGAPENINALLEIIESDSEIFKRVKAANYISERRWDIILDDINHGITILLPEKNVKAAWEKLEKLNESKNILKRKLTKIDLRLSGKITVKLEKTERPKRLKSKERKI